MKKNKILKMKGEENMTEKKNNNFFLII